MVNLWENGVKIYIVMMTVLGVPQIATVVAEVSKRKPEALGDLQSADTSFHIAGLPLE